MMIKSDRTESKTEFEPEFTLFTIDCDKDETNHQKSVPVN